MRGRERGTFLGRFVPGSIIVTVSTLYIIIGFLPALQSEPAATYGIGLAGAAASLPGVHGCTRGRPHSRLPHRLRRAGGPPGGPGRLAVRGAVRRLRPACISRHSIPVYPSSSRGRLPTRSLRTKAWSLAGSLPAAANSSSSALGSSRGSTSNSSLSIACTSALR